MKKLNYRVGRVSKTLVLRTTTAETVLLENTTVRNTSSGYHPVLFYKQYCLIISTD